MHEWKKKKKIEKKMADDVCNYVITKDEIKKFPILAKGFPILSIIA